MVTIKEIAKACGLSATAVSKALRNESDISKKTIDRVREVANEMGYSPNIAAVRLKTNKSYMLGILFNEEYHYGIEHEFFASIINPFIQKARDHGYSVMFVTDRVGENSVTPIEFAQAYGCDGILVLLVDFKDKDTTELLESSVPTVTVDYVSNHCSAIMSDNARGMSEMIKYAYKMGHRKIAYIYGSESFVTKNRVSSFYKTCEELELDIPDEYVVEGVYHDTNCAEQMTHQLLDLKNPPTFIFYQDDFAFIGGRHAISQRGLTIPDDISVAGYDGFVLSQEIKPNLMTWKQNTAEIGKCAANLLIDAIERPKTYMPTIVEVEGTLLKGQSVKDIN